MGVRRRQESGVFRDAAGLLNAHHVCARTTPPSLVVSYPPRLSVQTSKQGGRVPSCACKGTRVVSPCGGCARHRPWLLCAPWAPTLCCSRIALTFPLSSPRGARCRRLQHRNSLPVVNKPRPSAQLCGSNAPNTHLYEMRARMCVLVSIGTSLAKFFAAFRTAFSPSSAPSSVTSSRSEPASSCTTWYFVAWGTMCESLCSDVWPRF